MSYPPVAFPPPPPTANTLSSQERAARVRSSKKLSRVLGDVPRVLDDEPPETESIWRKRKPTHLPPLFKPSPSPSPCPSPIDDPFATCHRRGSVLSVAPSIRSNAPSTASGSSADTSIQRRTKLDRLRRKLGDELPVTAVFPTTPRTASPKRTPRGRTRSISRPADDARSITFSINSDESVHTVSLSAVRVRSPHPSRSRPKHVYQSGPLPPVPPIPARFADDEAGLVRPRAKVAAGSRIGGADFKAARRAKREGRMAEPGEMVEMVGFMW